MTLAQRTIATAIGIFLVLSVVAGGVLYLLHRAQVENVREVTKAAQKGHVELGATLLSSELSAVASDVTYLSEQGVLQRYLDTGEAAVRGDLAAEYLAFVTSKPFYDQVSLLDANGIEVVRVERRGGSPRIVPDSQLQDESGRDDVARSLSLPAGEVQVSPFAPNVVNGTIEQPIKPVIRFASPVHDMDGGNRGLVVLGYLGQPLLERIGSFGRSRAIAIWLVNADGHWLLGPSPDVEFAFLYPERSDRSFAQDYPNAWHRIENGPAEGQFQQDGDLFTYTAITPASTTAAGRTAGMALAAAPPAPRWLVITHVPAANLVAGRFSLALPIAVICLVLAVVSWLAAQHWEVRRAASQAIRRSEGWFRGLLESAPDGVVVTDGDGRIKVVNAQTEALFGYRRDELIGRPVEMLVPERNRGRHVGHRRDYLQAPRARPMGAGLNLSGARKDGSEFPVAISLNTAEIGPDMMIVADIRDMTEQRRTEKTIKEMNEHLQRDNALLASLNKELEAFSYSVSHDLRAPLRAIDGFSQALLEDYAERLDAEGRNYLTRVRRAAQRMGMLIDDLLKLARVSRLEMQLAEVDLSALAEEVVQDLRDDPERQAEITIEPGLVSAADPRLLRVAFENLFGNAWKFTGSRRLTRIAFGRIEQDDVPVYFIRDNGVGFDMAHAGKLFGAFQRLHDAGEFPGTGVGLATVQRIIHKHGGRVWCEAEVDRGAAFFFTLQARHSETHQD